MLFGFPCHPMSMSNAPVVEALIPPRPAVVFQGALVGIKLLEEWFHLFSVPVGEANDDDKKMKKKKKKNNNNNNIIIIIIIVIINLVLQNASQDWI